jgi:signal transduction histidine kinase
VQEAADSSVAGRECVDRRGDLGRGAVGAAVDRLSDLGLSGIRRRMDAVVLRRSYLPWVDKGGRVWQRAGDGVVVAALIAAELEAWLSNGVGSRGLVSVLLVVAALPLLWRRRFPFAAPLLGLAVLACSPLFVGQVLFDSGAVIPVALVAGWALGRGNERGRALVGLAAAYLLFLVVVARASGVGIGDVVYGSLQLLAPWLAGQAVRSRDAQVRELRERAARVGREREQRRRAAVAEERLRIARELHDVIAHSISVMTIQAGGARLLLESDPVRAEEALLRVEETARGALAEMRRLPGVLGHDGLEAAGGPRASLASLSSLLDQVRGAGLPVELTVEGSARLLPAGLDVAAYRIVQEALTNALKHAGCATTRVMVRYEPNALALKVEDDGAEAGAASRGGHGLAGMRERVSMYGGEMRAGRRPEGGYLVQARLPLEQAR